MDALIPQKVLEGKVEVIGLCNFNLYTQKTIAICLRVSDVVDEFATVNSTWEIFKRKKMEFKIRCQIINEHTPYKLSVHLRSIGTGVGERFKRDTEYILGNLTLRIEVISDSRDSRRGVRRHSTYPERVGQTQGFKKKLTHHWWGWFGQHLGKKININIWRCTTQITQGYRLNHTRWNQKPILGVRNQMIYRKVENLLCSQLRPIV